MWKNSSNDNQRTNSAFFKIVGQYCLSISLMKVVRISIPSIHSPIKKNGTCI